MDASEDEVGEMSETALQRVMTEARDCALIMMENASYIEGELPRVAMSDPLRAQTERVCADLTGTKHDVVSELFDLDELIEADAPPERLVETIDRILGWIGEDMGRMHELVCALRAATAEDPDHGLAYVLVMESATNILDAFNRVAAAADAFRPS